MTPLGYYLWGAVKDKRYADKPKTIEALKDNVREAIGTIQLHTIDNVLQNWNDCVVSNKIENKRNLGKYSIVFFKAFCKKKRYMADPV